MLYKETLFFYAKNKKCEFCKNYASYHYQNPAQGGLCYYKLDSRLQIRLEWCLFLAGNSTGNFIRSDWTVWKYEIFPKRSLHRSICIVEPADMPVEHKKYSKTSNTERVLWPIVLQVSYFHSFSFSSLKFSSLRYETEIDNKQ